MTDQCGIGISVFFIFQLYARKKRTHVILDEILASTRVFLGRIPVCSRGWSVYSRFGELTFTPNGSSTLLPPSLYLLLCVCVFFFSFCECVSQCEVPRCQRPGWSVIQVEAGDCMTRLLQVTQRVPEGEEGPTKISMSRLSRAEICPIVAAGLHINVRLTQ